MNLISKSVVKNLLKKHKIRPLGRLGQNFLVDKIAVKKIIKSAELHLKDVILEIGPGVGAITQELAKRVKKVIAIEKDPVMVEILKETLKDFKNIEIIRDDILKMDISTFNFQPLTFKVVANLPFYITAAVIRKFLENDSPPRKMILMVQKEVAQRICAKPPKMNLLAVSVQFYAKPKIISHISKESSWPIPNVDSAIIQIIPRDSTYGSASFREQFFKVVKAGFSHPRKQLGNNLSKMLKLDKQRVQELFLKTNIQPSQRAETLSVGNWIKLTETIKDF